MPQAPRRTQPVPAKKQADADGVRTLIRYSPEVAQEICDGFGEFAVNRLGGPAVKRPGRAGLGESLGWMR